MVQHAIKPQQARYILDRQDLLNFLKGKFDGKHPNHEFKIVVCTRDLVHRTSCR
jgi:hypothetical protein